MNDKALIEKLESARWWILDNAETHFYGALAMSLPDKLGNPVGKTACVDGRAIFWDRDFLAKLTKEETRFVILHETFHVAHGHLWRLPCTKEGNVAGDYAINGELDRMARRMGGKIKLSAGVLIDAKFSTMSEEEILHALRAKPQPPQPQPPAQDQQQQDDNEDKGDDEQGGEDGDSDASGSEQSEETDEDGKPAEGEGNGQDEGEGEGSGSDAGEFCKPRPESADEGEAETPSDADLKATWEQRIVSAAQACAASQGRGHVPAEFAEKIKAITAPVALDWKAETAAFLRTAISDRNDWTRSARRHATARCIIPRRQQNKPGLVIAARDTSGSIGRKQLATFGNHVASMAAELGSEVIVIDIDDNIQQETRLQPGDEVPDAPAGGGTDFRPVFERAQELAESGENIAGIVYLTDLEGPYPATCEHPLLWVCVSKAKARIGTTINIEPTR